MLESIKIKNFAIIENTEIEFSRGLTVLTGETGAGKTIIIDAIGLLLGNRASLEMIRYNEEKAIIEGVFTSNNRKLFELMEENDIEVDQKIIITRKLTKNGTTLKINGSIVLLSIFKNISKYLIDIHLQHDTHRLIKESNYLEILDSFSSYDFTEYKSSLIEYTKKLKEYNNIINSIDDAKKELDFYAFQKAELEKLSLNKDEEIELNERQIQLENFDKIYQNLSTATKCLKEKNAVANIYNAKNSLDNLSELDNEYKDFSKRLENIYYELEEVAINISDKLRSLEFSPYELSNIQERLSEIKKIKKKYGKDIGELVIYLEEINLKIDQLDGAEFAINKGKKMVESFYDKVALNAQNITIMRKKSALKLSRELIIHLGDLELSNADFKIIFNETKYADKFKNIFKRDGVDEIDFLVTTNQGEPLKSLNKTASGGEISRIMLALKTVLIKSQKLSTIIFDEIDTGVSGFIASSIAKKIKIISESTQVLLITHLPQVAAQADHHLHVSKKIIAGRTVSSSKTLTKEERILEIAKMLSGDDITKSSLEHAKSLLEENLFH